MKAIAIAMFLIIGGVTIFNTPPHTATEVTR